MHIMLSAIREFLNSMLHLEFQTISPMLSHTAKDHA